MCLEYIKVKYFKKPYLKYKTAPFENCIYGTLI